MDSLLTQLEAGRANKLAERLGGEADDGLLYKPKGMHEAIFNRLVYAAGCPPSRLTRNRVDGQECQAATSPVPKGGVVIQLHLALHVSSRTPPPQRQPMTQHGGGMLSASS